MNQFPIKPITCSLLNLLLIAGIALFSACDNEEVIKPVQPVNQNENPSHVRLVFTNLANAQDSVIAAWDDADGIAGITGPVKIDSIKLKTSTNYQLRISISNRTVSPVINLTSEIAEEKNAHQFFFKPSPMTLLMVDSLDKDNNNLPFGLTSKVHTSSPGIGTLQVDLDHFDAVVKSGSNRSGSTDISIMFPVIIK
jgi:hypothetical protein